MRWASFNGDDARHILQYSRSDDALARRACKDHVVLDSRLIVPGAHLPACKTCLKGHRRRLGMPLPAPIQAHSRDSSLDLWRKP